MGKRREPDIFDDNPLTEDFLEWMVSPDGQTAGEVSGLVFATLENASVDAKRRKVIWADGERLSIEQSAERIHAEHPDRPRELIEISLCSWFEHRVPESGHRSSSHSPPIRHDDPTTVTSRLRRAPGQGARKVGGRPVAWPPCPTGPSGPGHTTHFGLPPHTVHTPLFPSADDLVASRLGKRRPR
jgi:hypothetical protein